MKASKLKLKTPVRNRKKQDSTEPNPARPRRDGDTEGAGPVPQEGSNLGRGQEPTLAELNTTLPRVHLGQTEGSSASQEDNPEEKENRESCTEGPGPLRDSAPDGGGAGRGSVCLLSRCFEMFLKCSRLCLPSRVK